MSKTVVVIDDSKYILKQIITFFEKKLQLKVLASGHDGNDAVELYREYQPDLITLDITMPNKNGEQAMKEIIDEFPDANVLIISAVRGDTVLDCMSNGAKGYIEKPLKFANPEFIDDFKKTIDEIFNY
jgi:two-component system, chemotaxis family, chemotaxis protein CheY